MTQLPADVPDAEVLRLDAAGVRAVRVNLRRGGSAPPADLDRLARRVHELAGWHTELHVDGRDLADLAPVLHPLPQVVVDHLGLHADGLPDLLRLVETGAVVKATGFGRVELDVADAVARVLAVDPGALVAGTDLPAPGPAVPSPTPTSTCSPTPPASTRRRCSRATPDASTASRPGDVPRPR